MHPSKRISTIGFPWLLAIATGILLCARVYANIRFVFMPPPKGSQIAWLDLKEANRADKDRPGKLLLYYFKATASMPCWMMDRTILTNSEVSETIRTKFIPIEVPMESGSDGNYSAELLKLTNKYHVEAAPTLVAALPTGERVNRLDGLNRCFEVATFLRQASRDAVCALAYKHYEMRKPDQAAKEFRQWLQSTNWHDYESTWSVIYCALSYKLAHDDQNASAILQDGLSHLYDKSWPYPILKYLQGNLTAEALLSSAKNDLEKLGDAHHIIGMNYLFQGKEKEAEDQFKWIVENDNHGRYEYTRAVAELSALKKTRPVSPDSPPDSQDDDSVKK